ncbi:hypothetical protein QUB60_12795 [Microcoleus sp. A2-C5]
MNNFYKYRRKMANLRQTLQPPASTLVNLPTPITPPHFDSMRAIAR